MGAEIDQSSELNLKHYQPLAYAAGIGSLLGSGIIVCLSATIKVWQDYLHLSVWEVGIISSGLTIAIAIGSLCGGYIADLVGRVRFFNYINLLYALGAALCVFSPNFGFLLAGVIVAGVASGADLPVSLAVVSQDAPDEGTQAHLVSSTQVWWSIGIFFSYAAAAITSTAGIMGARLVFAVLAIIALIAFMWRTFSKTFKKLHEEGETNRRAGSASNGKKVSAFAVLSKGKYAKYFVLILAFYVFWNLLANTFGQFQTYLFRIQGASQTLATTLGVVFCVLSTITTWLFSKFSDEKWRKKLFWIGAAVEIIAMVLMAAGGSLWFTVVAVMLYNLFSNYAGEPLYKVWTQESFPVEVRSSIQGWINGLSRGFCAIFAAVTPALFEDGIINTTMWLFVGIAVISIAFGVIILSAKAKDSSKS